MLFPTYKNEDIPPYGDFDDDGALFVTVYGSDNTVDSQIYGCGDVDEITVDVIGFYCDEDNRFYVACRNPRGSGGVLVWVTLRNGQFYSWNVTNMGTRVFDEEGNYYYEYANGWTPPANGRVVYGDSLSTFAEIKREFDRYFGLPAEIPITYIPINSTLSGPESASSGDTVTADVTFPDGYNIKHTGEGGGISVYNQDGSIPFTYNDGKITFTMP